MSIEQVKEIARRLAEELDVTVTEALGPDGRLTEAARNIYSAVAGNAPVFAV
ncbi:hypothetical protein [Streptomyces sp. S.PNR 29]|uniref:hypothetical protein n=1 Tax=Streptomyces sp. S.PNR 29 TaxID=2973805 RepID=UPI0025B121FB|nr:hypothetical protein [Streptomyces sp. S.PNR 29]MDN0198096.1 hypothetical protein [Streptomyces sp. S.PNR 29]